MRGVDGGYFGMEKNPSCSEGQRVDERNCEDDVFGLIGEN